MNQHVPVSVFGLFPGNAEEFAVGSVDELTLAIDAGHPQDRRTTVGHDAETIFALVQRFRGPLALGNVFDMNDKTLRSAGADAHQRDPGSRPDNIGRAVNVPLFEFHEGGWIVHQPLDRLL